MAADDNSIGSISVLIEGDYGGLIADLNAAENLAKDAGQQIADGLSAGASGLDKMSSAAEALSREFPDLVGVAGAAAQQLSLFSKAMEAPYANAAGQLNLFSGALEPIPGAAQTTAQALEQLRQSQAGLNQSTDGILPKLEGIPPAIEAAGAAASGGIPPFQDLVKAALGFVGIELGAKALLDFAKDAIESYAAVERATISIDALTGSAGRATGIIAGLKDLAIQDALSFPSLVTAEQRMLAFGVNADKIPTGLKLIADTAAALGRNFDQMSDRFDRVIETGNISGRTLVLLGINMRDVASAMGVTEGAASSAFKALDQSGRIDVLSIALEKFSGTAEAVAQSVSGQWQNLKTQTDFTFQGIGQALAPLASQLIGVSTEAVKETGGLVSGFNYVSNAVDTFYEHLSIAETGLDDTSGKMRTSSGAVQEAGVSWHDFVPTVQMFGTAFQYATDIVDLAIEKFPALGQTVEQLDAKVAKATTTTAEFKEAWNLSQIEAGFIPFTAGMQDVTKHIDDSKAKAQEAKAAYDNFSNSLENNTKMANGQVATQEQVDGAYAKVQSTLKALDVTASGHIQTADQLEHKEGELQDAVEKARQTLSEEQAKMDSGTGSAGALKAAHDQLASAVKAAHESIAGHVLSLGDLITKNSELNAALSVAQSVYDQVTARVKAGSGEYNLQSEALKQLTAAHKALGDSETNVHLIMEITKEKVSELIDKTLAQGQAVDNLAAEYGPHNLAVDLATKAYDSLLKQLGLTKQQITDLTAESDRTGTSLMDLVNQAAITAGAFKELGMTSSAQFKQMAADANVAYLTIAATATSTMGEVYAAADKVRQANLNVRDSTTGLALAFQDAGIKSSQAFGDAAAKIDAAFKFIAASGGAAYADLIRASDAARNADFAYQQSLSVTTDAFRNLGITSSAQLQHVAEENKIMYDRIRNDAMSSGGDIDRAWQTWQKSVDKYHESMLPLPDAHKAIGSSAKDAFHEVTDSIYTAITACEILTADLAKQEAQYQKAASASFADIKDTKIGSVGLNFSGTPNQIMAQRDQILSGSPGQSIPVGSPGERALTQLVDTAALIAAGAAAGGFSGTGKFAPPAKPAKTGTKAADSIMPDVAAMGAYIAAQQAAENTVKNLTLVVQDLTAKQDGSTIMSRALAAAQADLQKALQATGQTTSATLSVADAYVSVQQAAQQKVTTLTQAVADLKDKQDGTAVMTLALTAAQKDLATATAAATVPVQQVAKAFDAAASGADYAKTTVETLNKQQTDAQQKVQMLAQAVQKLTEQQDGSVVMQRALTLAQDDLNAALAAWKPLLYDLTTAEGRQADAQQTAIDLANKYTTQQAQATAGIQKWTTVVDLLTQAQDGTTAMSKALADAQKQLADAEAAAGVSTTKTITLADQYIATQTKAQDTVAALTLAVADLTAKQDGTAAMALALSAAEKDLATATAAVTPVVKAQISTADQYILKQQDALDTVARLTEAVATLKAEQDGTTPKALALAQAEKDLGAATAAVTPVVQKATIDISTAAGQQAGAVSLAADMLKQYTGAQHSAADRVGELTIVVGILTKAQDGTKGSADALAQAQIDLGIAQQQAGLKVTDLTKKFDPLASAADYVTKLVGGLTKTQTDNANRVAMLQIAVQTLTAEQDGSAVKTQALATAQKDLQTALDASTASTLANKNAQTVDPKTLPWYAPGPNGTVSKASMDQVSSSLGTPAPQAASLPPDIAMLQSALKVATSEQLASLPNEIANVLIEAMSVMPNAPRSTVDKVMTDITASGGALKLSAALAPPTATKTTEPTGTTAPTSAGNSTPSVGTGNNAGTTIYMYNTVSNQSLADSLVSNVQSLGTNTGRL